MEKVLTVTFQLKGKEIEEMEKAFKKSGLRSKSELIRTILLPALKRRLKK